MNIVLEQDANRYAGGGYQAFKNGIGRHRRHQILL